MTRPPTKTCPVTRFSGNATGGDPLFNWMIFTGVSAFILFLLLYFGLIQKMITSDLTHISTVILVLYIATALHCFTRTAAVSRETQAARHIAQTLSQDRTLVLKGPIAVNGSVATHINDLIAKARLQNGRRLDQSLLLRVLAGKLRGSNPIGAFSSDTLMKLGLLGTIVGFIMMLGPIAGLDTGNQGALKSSMSLMSDGMAVAMYTTLAGLAGSILLKIQYYMLEGATSSLFSLAVEITEVHVVSQLDAQPELAP